jgi:hypothetical protein
MQKGEEPLRSFGDLLQFFGKATSSKTADQNPPAVTEPATDSSAVETVDSRSHQSVESHQGHDVAEELRGVEVQETPSTADTPES